RTVKVVGQDYTISNGVFSGDNGKTLDQVPKKGFVYASADIKNNTSEDKTVTLVAALYNKKGELENLSGITNVVPSGTKETFTGGFKLPGNNSGYHIELFVAESLTNLKPISNISKIAQK